MTDYQLEFDSYESDCNCATSAIENEDDHLHQGKKGTTVWKSIQNPITIPPYNQAPNNKYIVSFTDTHPNCSSDTSACLITYRVHTSQDSNNPAVKLTTELKGEGIGSVGTGRIFHSKYANHDVEEVVDLQQMVGYSYEGKNEFTITNMSDVNVQLCNLRIFRAYDMTQLDAQSPNDPLGSCGSSGNLDNTREDYPCNYFSYGKRYSFSYWLGHQTVNEISVNDTFTYTFQNPPTTIGSSNYLNPIACFFNFNNTYTSDSPSGYEIHYIIELNNTIIKHFYIPTQNELGQPNQANQFPGVDLVEFGELYNDGPEETNVIKIYPMNTQGKLKLVDNTDGYVNIYRFYEVKNLCQDSFDDEITDENIWRILSVGNYDVNEVNNRLQVAVTSGGSWSQAGYVTKFPCSVQQSYGSSKQGFEVAINVDSIGQLEEMDLLLSPSPLAVPAQDPYNLNNWYRILKNNTYSTVMVQNRLGGGAVSNKLSIPWASSTGQLKIKASTGSIAFYENGILRYAEPYALPSNDCYIYIYTSSYQIGTGTFDNYSMSPAEIVRDDFSDGNYNNWVVDSGSWTIQNGKLQSTAYNSHIHYYTVFSANRHVRADIQTLTQSGTNTNVAWLMINEQNGNNMIYALIRRDGTVELTMYYNGQPYTWTESSALDPRSQHSIATSIIGTNAKVWVDGTLYINADNNYFANIAGYVGCYSVGTTAAYGHIAVFSQ